MILYDFKIQYKFVKIYDAFSSKQAEGNIALIWFIKQYETESCARGEDLNFSL